MKKLDGSKEKLQPVQPEEMANSTEKMIHEERFNLFYKNRTVSVDHGPRFSGSSRVNPQADR